MNFIRFMTIEPTRDSRFSNGICLLGSTNPHPAGPPNARSSAINCSRGRPLDRQAWAVGEFESNLDRPFGMAICVLHWRVVSEKNPSLHIFAPAPVGEWVKIFGVLV